MKNGTSVIMRDNYIHPNDFDLILNALKYFGPLVKHLELITIGDTSEGNIEAILEYINKYCANSVTRLVVNDWPRPILHRLTELKQVQDLECDQDFAIYGSWTKPFNEMFPKLQVSNFYQIQ